jgi:UDP:flavonoid glycosyltransferase YjiC (YdhE family)
MAVKEKLLECGNEIKNTKPYLAEPSQKRALFIPASIRSHVLPVLYLADQISSEYDIYFAVTNQILADIVSENHFTPILCSPYRIAVGMEQDYLQSKKRKAGFRQVIHAVCTNELYWHRQQELNKLIAEIKPEVLIIDLFNSNDFLALYNYRFQIKIIFFNPMPSTYRIGNFPIVSEDTWPDPDTFLPSAKPVMFSLKRLLRNSRAELYNAALRFQLKRLLQLTQISDNHKLIETPFVRTFANVPEILLVPLEFELSSEVKKENQHYLGLCIRENRKDTELDLEFGEKWPFILNRKQAGDRIVYCSFGTFYTGSDTILLAFVTKLLEAIFEIPGIQLVCSVNNLVIETLKVRHSTAQNVHFFKRVPQLRVLEVSDVHITHGGLGSVKESIFFKVPMLVYPLDLHYDQNGNGLKVEQHGLGLRGVFDRERTANMKAKICRLLEDSMFKESITRFQEACLANYSSDKVKNILDELLTVST